MSEEEEEEKSWKKETWTSRTEKNGVRIWGERHEAGAAGQRMTRKPDKVGSWEKGGGSQSEGKREEKRLTARVEEISLLSVCQFDRRKTENSWGLSLHACVCACVLLPTAKTGCPVFGICEFTPEREREMGGTARTARDQRHTHTCVHTHTRTGSSLCWQWLVSLQDCWMWSGYLQR